MRARLTVGGVVLALAECGAADVRQDAEPLPAGSRNPAGLYYVTVGGADEVGRLCDQAQKSWPERYPDQVTFDIPDTGEDVTCVRVSGGHSDVPVVDPQDAATPAVGENESGGGGGRMIGESISRALRKPPRPARSLRSPPTTG
jgi:hypothetical protein